MAQTTRQSKKPTALEMQKIIDAQQKQLEQQQNLIAKLSAEKDQKSQRDSQIPRPPGQAGRGAQSGHGSFSLEQAMGLDSAHYNRLMRICKLYANKYLNVRLTFRQQDQGRLRKVKTLVVRKAAVLGKFRKAWPIDDYLKQYLCHFSSTIRKDFEAEEEDIEEPDREAIDEYVSSLGSGRRRRTDSEENEVIDMEVDEIETEIAAGIADSDEEVAAITPRRPMKPAKLTKPKKTTAPTQQETNLTKPINPSRDNQNAILEASQKALNDDRIKKTTPRRPPAIKKSVTFASETPNINISTEGEDEKGYVSVSPLKKTKGPSPRKKTKAKAKASGSDNSLVQQEEEDYLSSGQQDTAMTTEEDPFGSPLSSLSGTLTTSANTSVSRCPDAMCMDKVPAEPTAVLRGLLKAYAKDGGGNTPHFKALEICQEIKKHRAIPALLRQAEANDWPKVIDFQSLPDRIAKLSPKLMAFLSKAVTLVDLLQQNKLTFKDFNDMAEINKLIIFGPMGRAIIRSTLCHRLQLESESIDTMFSNTLSVYIEQKLTDSKNKMPSFWIQLSNDKLLKTKFVIEWILVPYIADLLIECDLNLMGCELDEADEVRIDSRAYGDHMFNDTETGLLDDITNENLRVMRRNALKKVDGNPLAAKKLAGIDQMMVLPPKQQRKENMPPTPGPFPHASIAPAQPQKESSKHHQMQEQEEPIPNKKACFIMEKNHYSDTIMVSFLASEAALKTWASNKATSQEYHRRQPLKQPSKRGHPAERPAEDKAINHEKASFIPSKHGHPAKQPAKDIMGNEPINFEMSQFILSSRMHIT
ncbi:hypothetical protein BDZ97DRAFT_1762003 [Flammula alnicola]|nr:hypothetical protein BDZ97DRAFT_1762003 [Flammula alnicola]